jgi:hypothetical protein
LDDRGVNDFSTGSLGMEQVHHKAAFDEVIKLDVLDDERKCRLKHRHGAKDNPVSHPLSSISIDNLSSLQCFEGHVRGVNKSQQVRKQFDSTNGKNKSYKNQDGADKEENLGLSGLGLQFLEFLCVIIQAKVGICQS